VKILSKDNIITHYPLLSNKYRKKSDNRTLCGEFVRTDHWIDGRKTYHMFTDTPNTLKCKNCRKIARKGGLVRYENASEKPVD
jgi:hypothetical protein